MNRERNSSRAKGKLLVCDMDGTLLDSRQRISPDNLNAINRFVEQGGYFTLATGRDEGSIDKFLDVLPVNLPVIIYNGAALYDLESGKVLWNRWLPDSTREVVKELMDRFPEMGVEVFKRSDIHILRNNFSIEAHVKRDSLKPIPSSLQDIPLPWTKVILGWHPEELTRVEEYLSQKPREFRHVYSQADFLELLSWEASKGRTLLELSKISGISSRNIVAMGDNLNDLEMIEYAGTGVAVSNAHDTLKECANLCCCHHDEHAVSQVIEWIERGKIAC